MSASKTLVSLPGAVTRRSPGSRLRGAAAAVSATRAKYLIPPLLALLVVAAAQFYGAATVQPIDPAADTTDSAITDSLITEPRTDLTPVTEIGSIGTVDTSDTDRRIKFWQDRVVAQPGSHTAWIYIGDLFDIKGRQTGDIAQYVSAQEAYQKAIAIAPQSSEAHAGNARILTTLHDFAGALREATRVLQIDPSATAAIAIVFDASVELGDLDNARLALDKLDDRVETSAITIRQAKLAFLGGDTAGAARLAHQAEADDAADGNTGAAVAFDQYIGAEYELLAGNLDAAQAGYDAAFASLPGYPLAVYGQGRVAYARGDIATATSLLETAVAAVPRPDMLAFLGDLYTVAGTETKAADQFATVDFIAEMAASTAGSVYDREYAIYLADHGQDTGHALQLSQAEATIRDDIYGHDALAWALHAAGQDSDALLEARQALSLGTVDAKLLIHTGLIEIANGLTVEGKAHLTQGLALNPAFSPLVVQAARAAVTQ